MPPCMYRVKKHTSAEPKIILSSLNMIKKLSNVTLAYKGLVVHYWGLRISSGFWMYQRIHDRHYAFKTGTVVLYVCKTSTVIIYVHVFVCPYFINHSYLCV